MLKKTFSAQNAGIAAVPCGQCKNCRINQSRIWTNRILLEQMCHSESVFVTLTYDNDNLPEGGNVEKKELQDFVKRLRYYVYPLKIRYFGVGEYGDDNFRPHYHIVIFGLSWLSQQTIKKAWEKGSEYAGVHIAELNKDTARYISGYVVKKINKIRGLHPVNYGLKDEFMISSKKGGGIGIEGARKIAKKLGANKYWKPNFDLTAVRVGGKMMPLGRYLTKKIRDELNTDEQNVMLKFWANQELYFEKCHGEGKDELYIRKGKL